jgi:hypothetical protein
MSFGELLYFFWVKERLIVPVATQQLKDVGMSCTRGYPIPARCPTGTSTGMIFYPWV